MRNDNKWYQRMWLPVAAYVYILICVFDFMIMPIYVTAHNSRIENEVFRELNGKDALPLADMIIKANQAQRQWNPLTLLGAGMFHISFGALLTGGAVTRGFAKKSEIEGYYKTQMTGYDPNMNGYNQMSFKPPMYQQMPQQQTFGPTQQMPVQNQQPMSKGQFYSDDQENSGPMPKTRNLDM